MGANDVTISCLPGSYDLASVDSGGSAAGGVPVDAVCGGKCLIVPTSVDSLPPAFMGVALVPKTGV